MTFEEAANFEMRFGKWKGYTLENIAGTGDGLDYLLWIVTGWKDLNDSTRDTIETFLDGIADQVEEHKRAKGNRR